MGKTSFENYGHIIHYPGIKNKRAFFPESGGKGLCGTGKEDIMNLPRCKRLQIQQKIHDSSQPQEE